MTERPTYEELRQLRQREWYAAQAKAASELAERHAALARMPDVRDAPDPEHPWGHRGIACPKCQGEGFKVTRWVTVNGLRHRVELECLGCRWLDTWDWETKRWMRS